jgi:hypothetical protein
MSTTTLGAGHPHIFVTRAATLQYQALRPLPFEEARRELTRLLLQATPVRGDSRRWQIEVPPLDPAPASFRDGVVEWEPRLPLQLVAYVVPRDGLLLVSHVRLAEDARDAHIPGPLDAEND